MSLSDCFALGALLVAVVALAFAGKANTIAKQSLELAQADHEESKKGTALAAEGNRIGVKGNQLSENSYAISERTAALQFESHDVAWETSWEGPGRVRLTNTGKDEARNVRVRLTHGDEVQLAERDTVHAGGSIDLEFPGARQEELAHEAARAEYERQRELGRWDLAAPVGVLYLPLGGRVAWQTALGGDRVHKF